ncbi:MAG TPA: pirin family protein [Nevskiaceae bacterium]|nr:pirin family protein [Nevskiaceae bacterium]
MIELVIDQQRRDLGGFEVARVLPNARRRMVGPFIFFDHMGPKDLPRGLPRSTDVRPHPHIGLSTVTYLFDGEIMHRDSIGSEQPIRAGEVNWMTAGRGISHSERFERARAQGGSVHGIQSWVALPTEFEETDPAFMHYDASVLPSSHDDGVLMRLIAGDALGVRSPVKTHSPLFYLHWQLERGASAKLPDHHPERALFIVSGDVEIAGRSYGAGQLLIFSTRVDVVLRALSPAVVMALGGEPLGHRYIEWNFVSSSHERIKQAKDDWQAGRFKLPVHDDQEFIPLPADPLKPAPPM